VQAQQQQTWQQNNLSILERLSRGHTPPSTGISKTSNQKQMWTYDKNKLSVGNGGKAEGRRICWSRWIMKIFLPVSVMLAGKTRDTRRKPQTCGCPRPASRWPSDLDSTPTGTSSHPPTRATVTLHQQPTSIVRTEHAALWALAPILRPLVANCHLTPTCSQLPRRKRPQLGGLRPAFNPQPSAH
jgi:hypothetical protein